MEDEYPSNSERARAERKERTERPAPEKRNEPVKKIYDGEVVRRKKSWGKRISETYFNTGSPKDIAVDVVRDILIPSGRDLIADAVITVVERALGIESRSRRRSSIMGPGSFLRAGPANHVSYRDSYRGKEDPRSGRKQRAMSLTNYEEIILDDRVRADQVIDNLIEMKDRYGEVSVGELYDLIGITGSHTDTKWGWTDLRSAGVERVHGGYLLVLPRPEPLD